MNRLILIGNGFDLAHNLPTSFKSFIDDYWKNLINKIRKGQPNQSFNSNDLFIERIPTQWAEGTNFETFQQTFKNYNHKINYKNKLLRNISIKSIDSWVDIENEYYNLLKESFKNQNSDYSICALNKDFSRIKQALGEYITNIENNFEINIESYKNQIGYKIYSPFKYQDATEKALNDKAQQETELIRKKLKDLKEHKISSSQISYEQQNLINKLSNIDEVDYYYHIRELLLNDSAQNYFNLLPDKILFLNFNYTKTTKYYENSLDFPSFENIRIPTKTIQIHGSVYTRDQNPIVFGFGDEIDNDYKTIENLNDNRYLEHIKSIKYLETENYKNLLTFINNKEYQIIIFGHSCGISDRTLLNTVFENDNCVSVKPYYHKLSETSDNYSDLIMNITRNFNDKSALRDKVVNKRFCEPLLLLNANSQQRLSQIARN
jgi:hypothetical protein